MLFFFLAKSISFHPFPDPVLCSHARTSVATREGVCGSSRGSPGSAGIGERGSRPLGWQWCWLCKRAALAGVQKITATFRQGCTALKCFYSSKDQRTSGLDHLLLSGSSWVTSSRGQHVSACSPASVLSIFFFCSWASLEKMSCVLCFIGSSCWHLIWGWCPFLAFLVFFQLHKDCLCFPPALVLTSAFDNQ